MKYNGIIKGSRTLDLALFEAIYGGVIAAAPEAFGVITGAPVDNKIVYYGCLVVGASKFILAGVHAYLRFDTTGPVGEK
jgi:hypothetical protein